MNIAEAVRKLSTRLPLKDRQRGLTPVLRALHRAILQSFHATGSPPSRATLGKEIGIEGTDDALRMLADNDLIVRGADGEIIGAYPFTTARTPHHLSLGECSVHAMCALDALAVAPMFASRVTIGSRCEVTAAPIHIEQDACAVVAAQPSMAIHVGIRWQSGGGAAADTL